MKVKIDIEDALGERVSKLVEKTPFATRAAMLHALLTIGVEAVESDPAALVAAPRPSRARVDRVA